MFRSRLGLVYGYSVMFDPIFEIAARPLFLARDARLLDPNEERKQIAGPEGLVTKIQHLKIKKYRDIIGYLLNDVI